MRLSSGSAVCAAAVTLLLVAGCSSLRSQHVPTIKENEDTKKVPAGLAYFMPTQDLQLTLTVAEPPKPKQEAPKAVEKQGARGKPPKKQAAPAPPTLVRVITLEKTPPVADPAQRYFLQYSRNHIGKNLLSVGIDESGLLSGESTGKTTPQFPELIKGIAGSVAGRNVKVPTRNDCKNAGTYQWSFNPFDVQIAYPAGLTACGIELIPPGIPAGSPAATEASVTTNSYSSTKKWESGYFYRQAIPARVEIRDTIANITSIHYPSIVSRHSPVYFLPIPRSVFAEVDWKVTFANGIPTLYKVDSGGDAIGLFQLPAEVVKAYSDAVLSGFQRKGTVDAERAKYLTQLNALAVAQAKNEACKAAVATQEQEAIITACQ